MMAAVKNNLNTPSILGGSEHAGPTGFLNSCNVMAVVLLVHFGVLWYHKIFVAVRICLKQQTGIVHMINVPCGSRRWCGR